MQSYGRDSLNQFDWYDSESTLRTQSSCHCFLLLKNNADNCFLPHLLNLGWLYAILITQPYELNCFSTQTIMEFFSLSSECQCCRWILFLPALLHFSNCLFLLPNEAKCSLFCPHFIVLVLAIVWKIPQQAISFPKHVQSQQMIDLWMLLIKFLSNHSKNIALSNPSVICSFMTAQWKA